MLDPIDRLLLRCRVRAAVDVQPETASVAALIDALPEFAVKRAAEERWPDPEN